MKNLFFVAVVCLLATVSFNAQSLSVIKGKVTDAAGAIVSGAEVSLLTSQQNKIQVTKTNSEGFFKLENIVKGSYIVVASQTDFKPQREAVLISEVVEKEVNLVLQVSNFSENVTVTAETGLAEDRIKIPQSINIILSDAISQRASTVLAQVADEETGVTFQKTSPTVGAVLVRGLTEVGVYVDGVRYTNSTQRGGINTFFNLNEPSGLQSVEIQRSPNTAQFGSDGLAGNAQFLSRQPQFGFDKNKLNGEFNTFYGTVDNSFGSNLLLNYGSKRFGLLGNINGRRINTLRTGKGVDSHSAITRFLGLPSNFNGSDRLTDTAFTQFGSNFQASFSPTDNQQFSFRYQRSQQDGGKRYDQLLGGDGNLIAELKNLMLDFGYLRYTRQGFGFFDSLSATVSYNSQREERINQGGQGNPSATITNDKERTTAIGFSFFLDKQFKRNSFLFGGDIYRDKVTAPSFSTNPVNNAVTRTRPRVPNGAKYDLFGVYAQDSWDAIHNRLRISGAVRYNVGQYKSRAENAPIVNNQRLFPDDSARFADFSGRIGTVLTITEGFNFAFNFSRGFRAPNITSLGSLGLVGVGFQVSNDSVAGIGATVGSTADANAVSTGIAISPLKSEVSNNFDFSLRYRKKRFDGSITAFLIDYKDAIVRQTLILPQGAVGLRLGSETIASQTANGAVFVSLSTSPVLVQANFTDTRLNGSELTAEYRISNDWTIAGNYSYVFAQDRATGDSPNLGGGGIPPAFGFMRLRYQPTGKKYWVEGYANAAGRQSRLSTLDLADRRTGGSRSRNQIQNFFRRGACVRGITSTGTNGQCGTSGGTLLATGETSAQLQNRLLPLGATINGVFIADNDTSVPLFNAIPGYALFNVRGGYRFNEKHEVNFEFENIGDKSHRSPGSGIDGSGRSFRMSYRVKF
jgi:hemoglobin/transferrin/lactoferrin receptor protein